MPWISAAVAVGGKLLGDKINANRRGDGEQPAQDTRETALEQLFSESFLNSLTEAERTQLQTQVSTAQQEQRTDQLTREQGTETTTRGTAESQAALANIIEGGAAPSGEAAIQASINRVLRSGSPLVANVGSQTGTFGSTAEARAANDLIIRAAEAGALQELNQENINTQNLLAAIQASQAGTEETAIDRQQAGTGLTTTESQEQQDLVSREELREETTQFEETAQQSTEDRFTNVSQDDGIDRTNLPLGVGRTDSDRQAVGEDAPNVEERRLTDILTAGEVEPTTPVNAPGTNIPTNVTRPNFNQTDEVTPKPVTPSQGARDSASTVEQVLAPDVVDQLIAAPSGTLI